VLRRRGASIACFLDAAAPGLLVAQAIGRMGNYFNQELFGRPTSLPWSLHIDPAHRPPGYAQYATFQPTFLYELIWDLGLAVALVRLGRRRRVRAPGLFALYVAGYSGFRVFEELLRVDPAHHIFGLRLNFFVASLLTVFGLIWFIRIQYGRRRAGRVFGGGRAALGIAPLLCALAGCGHGHALHAEGLQPAATRPDPARSAGALVPQAQAAALRETGLDHRLAGPRVHEVRSHRGGRRLVRVDRGHARPSPP
jgi:hypothetical protein